MAPKSVSADEARAALARCPRLPAEILPLHSAAGRVLAHDLVAHEAVPAWPRSAMDGYAVRTADLTTTPKRLHIVGGVPVGDELAHPLLPGQAAAIPTGGVIPDGADAVVMIEHTTRDGDVVTIQHPAKPQQHIIPIAADVTPGRTLLPAGTRLQPPQLAVLASLGITAVDVVSCPRVAVLSTGSEVIPLEATPRRGQVRDANQVALVAAANAAGAHAFAAGLIADDAAALRRALADAADRADVVLVTGGSSVGERDLTADVLADLGAEIVFHGVALRPGRPTLFARLGPTAFLGLPGVPASALIVFHALVADLLAHLSGLPAAPRARRQLPLAHDIDSAPGREDWLRITIQSNPTSHESHATVLPGGQMSLATLLAADALLRIPSATASLPAGTLVDLELLR